MESRAIVELQPKVYNSYIYEDMSHEWSIYKIKNPLVKRSLNYTPSVKRPFSRISSITSPSITSGSTLISIPYFLQRGAHIIPLQA